MTSVPPSRCDIFCTVVDNYGDIGVCWRLAKQLQNEHGWVIRLWVDDLAPLAKLAPDTQLELAQQQVEAIEVRLWPKQFPTTSPAAIVIEAFACELPENYIAAMAAEPTPPVWLNLEYLSMEDWAPGCHGLPSPHPSLPLQKYFFFPGILQGTGGLLCEHNLNARRSAFNQAEAREGFSAAPDALWVSLFCYENPALPYLLQTWSEGEQAVNCLVAEGKAADQVAAWLQTDFAPGTSAQRGQLRLHALPFVPQESFDELLWACDLNFVRGEDSFARAQWAALPFIWQIYPQAENAHHTKLNAFLQRYIYGLKAGSAMALRSFNAVWNQQLPASANSVATAWAQLQVALPSLLPHAKAWQKQILALGNLSDNLANFCKKR